MEINSSPAHQRIVTAMAASGQRYHYAVPCSVNRIPLYAPSGLISYMARRSTKLFPGGLSFNPPIFYTLLCRFEVSATIHAASQLWSPAIDVHACQWPQTWTIQGCTPRSHGDLIHLFQSSHGGQIADTPLKESR